MWEVVGYSDKSEALGNGGFSEGELWAVGESRESIVTNNIIDFGLDLGLYFGMFGQEVKYPA